MKKYFALWGSAIVFTLCAVFNSPAGFTTWPNTVNGGSSGGGSTNLPIGQKMTNIVVYASDTNHVAELIFMPGDGSNIQKPGLVIAWPGINDSLVGSKIMCITNATGFVIFCVKDNQLSLFGDTVTVDINGNLVSQAGLQGSSLTADLTITSDSGTLHSDGSGNLTAVSFIGSHSGNGSGLTNIVVPTNSIITSKLIGSTGFTNALQFQTSTADIGTGTVSAYKWLGGNNGNTELMRLNANGALCINIPYGQTGFSVNSKDGFFANNQGAASGSYFSFVDNFFGTFYNYGMFGNSIGGIGFTTTASPSVGTPIIGFSTNSLSFGMTNGTANTVQSKWNISAPSLTLTNSPTLATNAAPTSVTIGVTAPDTWVKFTNGSTVYFMPAWANH